MRRHDDFERQSMRIFHELLVARLEVFVPILLRLHPIGLELELGKFIFGVDVGVSLFEHRTLIPTATLFLEIFANAFRLFHRLLAAALQNFYVLVEPTRPVRLVCTC